MSRKIVVSSSAGVKDDQGAFVKVGPQPEPPAPRFKRSETDLEEMLNGQILALGRTTKALLERSVAGLNKDEVASLATCIKLTLELREKEKALLNDMSDDELAKIASKD